jgi:ATP-dependent Lon protease
MAERGGTTIADLLDEGRSGLMGCSESRPVELFEVRALAAAIAAASPAGDAMLSPEAEGRLSLLQGLIASGNLTKPGFVPASDVIQRLDSLSAITPNAVRAIDVVRHASALSLATGTALRVPPMVLVGPPGSGKSRAASGIVRALGMPAEVVLGASLSDPGPICGYGLAWRGAGPGRVARSLIASRTMGIAIVVDEADKVASWQAGQRTLDALLPLLEATTAGTFEDDYVGVPMRADGVVWILTANDVTVLSEPLLDRCIVVEMPALDGREALSAVERIVDELATEFRIMDAELPLGALRLLSEIPPRRARLVLRMAFGIALGNGRARAGQRDVIAALRLSERDGQGRQGRRMGFSMASCPRGP